MPEQSRLPVHYSDLTVRVGNEASMDRLGAKLGARLRAGDVVAIKGPLGAGKSHLCRSLIRERLGDPHAEVPSPSYTLVNVYQTDGPEIWHADLYRIADGDELLELGLEDALTNAVVLIEWPDRWEARPERRLDIVIDPLPDQSRQVTLTPHAGGWDHVMAGLESKL